MAARAFNTVLLCCACGWSLLDLLLGNEAGQVGTVNQTFVVSFHGKCQK